MSVIQSIADERVGRRVRFRNLLRTLFRCGAYGVPLFMVILFDNPMHAQALICDRDLAEAQPIPTPEERWRGGNAYHVTTVTDPQTKRVSVRISGDQLRIDESVFKSLISGPDTPIDVASLTFDAHTIILDMPLYFKSTRVVLQGNTVHFTGRGQVSFSPDTMPQLGGDGIKIIANELDLSVAKNVPFDFQTDNWAYIQNTSEKPWPKDRHRHFNVSVLRVVHGTLLKNDKKTLIEFFRSRTQDRGYGYALDNESLRPYIIQTGEGAKAAINEMQKTATWPKERAASAVRVFAQAPYDAVTASFLKSLIAESLAIIPKEQQASRAMLHRISTTLRQATDLFGRTRYYVPKISFESARESFKAALVARLKLIEGWEPSVARALERSGIDQVGASRMQETIRTLRGEYEDSAKQLDELNAELNNVNTQARQITQDISNRNSILEKKYQELVASNAEAARKKGEIRTIGTVLSLLPTSAPLGFAIAAATSVGTEVAFNPEYRKGVTIENIGGLLKVSAEFDARVTTVRNSWRGMKDAYQKIKTSPAHEANAARTAFWETSTSFQTATTELLSATKEPGPTDLKVEEYKQSDQILNQRVEQLAAIRDRQRPMVDKLRDLDKRVASLAERITQQETVFGELLIPTVVNDQALASNQLLALEVLDESYRQLASEANLLRRAYVYATGEDIAAPKAITSFADLYEERSLGLTDQALSTDSAKRAIEATKQLSAVREAAKQNFEALLSAVETGYKDYCERVTCNGRPVSALPFPFSKNTDIGKAVIRQLNDAIRRSRYASRNTQDILSVPLPVTWEASDYRINRRIVYAEITDVKFADPNVLGDDALELQLHNDNVGFVRKNGCVFPVDFRQPDRGPSSDFLSGTVLLKDKSTKLQDKPDWTVMGPFKYAYYPLDSRFTVRPVYRARELRRQAAILEVIEFRVMFYVYP